LPGARWRPEVLPAGGLARCADPKKYRQPVLVSGADGRRHQSSARFELRRTTRGIDLVAMSVKTFSFAGPNAVLPRLLRLRKSSMWVDASRQGSLRVAAGRCR